MTRSLRHSVVLWLALTGEAGAVCSQPAPRVCSEFFRAAAVFTGVVTSRLAGDDETQFTLQVKERFRGALGESVDVAVGNDSGRLDLKEGREYLLFARRARGRLEAADDCAGSSGPVEQAAERIAAIRALADAPTTIEGRVTTRMNWRPVPGVKLEISGNGRAGTVETDERGAFRLEVAPGTYSVRPLTPGVTAFDLSTDDPRRVTLEKGQCGLVQFVGAPMSDR
ncbi:MAG TPA: carboxypeptidase-like regulatory domain-containing protein [Myxococcota bacterium]|nr:carboxypeptidase-like regulatory domain-containing protein [Myxococcota bacterium]